MIWFSKSSKFQVNENICSEDSIFLLTQFFIHRNVQRQQELLYCLQQNCKNPYIEKIYLLNEKIYTQVELGLNDTQMQKIHQIDIGRRIKFRDIFDYIDKLKLHGFVVSINSDIILDNTIEKLKYSPEFERPTMVALLRYEYNNKSDTFEKNCQESSLFGPRGDSQDTWILHSKHNIPETQRKLFEFEFGKPGCDNKMTYLFHFLNYQVYNDPLEIKTYHYHRIVGRDYTIKDRVSPIFEYFAPCQVIDTTYSHAIVNTNEYTRWNFEDNDRFRSHLSQLIENGSPFFIPELLPIDNRQSQKFIEVFQSSMGYFALDTYKEGFHFIKDPLLYLLKNYQQKQWIWSEVRNILHFVFRKPWTLALKNKTIYIVSPNAEKMKTQVLNNIFPVEIFQNNQFHFTTSCSQMCESYDIALLDTPEVNFDAYELYKKGKSAIVMGYTLNFLFGLFQPKDMILNGDFFRGFLTKEWKQV